MRMKLLVVMIRIQAVSLLWIVSAAYRGHFKASSVQLATVFKNVIEGRLIKDD